MTHAAMTGTASYVRPGDWAADPAACSLTFAVRKFVLGTVTGQIPLASATVHVDAGGHPVSIRAELDAGGTAPGLLVGHLVTLSLAIRLRPPVTTVATAQADATRS